MFQTDLRRFVAFEVGSPVKHNYSLPLRLELTCLLSPMAYTIDYFHRLLFGVLFCSYYCWIRCV